MSMASSEEVYRCRETAADFFHAPDETRVIFTANCTMALNMAIKGILRGGGRALISDLEHNAVLRPLHALSPQHPRYEVVRVTPGNDDATVAAFRARITRSTRVIICTHASNVFGLRMPIRRLGELAHRHGLLFVVDAAQTAGVCPIDMQRDHIDFLCVPGHKGLYGPMGTGMLICGSRFELPALLQGGTGSQSHLETMPDFLPVAPSGTARRSAGSVGKRHTECARYLRAACGHGVCRVPRGGGARGAGAGAYLSDVRPAGKWGSPAVYRSPGRGNGGATVVGRGGWLSQRTSRRLSGAAGRGGAGGAALCAAGTPPFRHAGAGHRAAGAIGVHHPHGDRPRLQNFLRICKNARKPIANRGQCGKIEL